MNARNFVKAMLPATLGMACLLVQPVRPALADEPSGPGSAGVEDDRTDRLRSLYRRDALDYRFAEEHSEATATHLAMVDQPVMSWANDDDWSGDVFVWTAPAEETEGGRPAVIGCILSGPTGTEERLVFHEFHQLSERPLAPTGMKTAKTWQPQKGLPIRPIPDAASPAKSATSRLSQMRGFCREFSAWMEAEGKWELRLLPQPVFRYGSEQGDVVDGAIFAYVWTKGTDPELLLLLECRRNGGEQSWYYSPVQFTNRPAWLMHNDREVWRIERHQEPAGDRSELSYTTAYSRTVPLSAMQADEISPSPPK